jgi:hypothetical protein
MLENMMMLMESGFKSNLYAFSETTDDDTTDTLPQAQQEYILRLKLNHKWKKKLKI